MITTKEKNLYGNWVVLAPDKKLLSYVSEKQAMWYIKRDLATIINVRTIVLNFEPKGRNTDDYSLQRKQNQCVVCGSTHIKSLTKHHVVPSMYKKLFPLEYKARSSHDIVVICRDCHNTYEQGFADLLKQQLAIEFDAPLQFSPHKNNKLKSIMICRTITKYWDEIPGERLGELLNDFKILNGWEPDDFDQIDEFIEMNENIFTVEKSHSSIVIEKYKEDYMKFIVMWRQHFIDTMKPKFMPEYWNINYTDFILKKNIEDGKKDKCE